MSPIQSCIKTKSTNIDLVTQVDIESEQLLVNRIKTKFPEAEFEHEDSINAGGKKNKKCNPV